MARFAPSLCAVNTGWIHCVTQCYCFLQALFAAVVASQEDSVRELLQRGMPLQKQPKLPME